MSGQQFTILIADDDRGVVELLAHALSSSGYHVLTAGDGQEAIEVAIREEPDLVVLDVGMPKADGYEVTRALRERSATRETPIIMLTGHRGEELAAKGFEVGVDDYLLKPVALAQVLARVQTWLLRHSESDAEQGARSDDREP